MLHPCGYRILVLPDEIEKEIKEGKLAEVGFEIVLTEQQQRLEEASQHLGTIVAVGTKAWAYHRDIDSDGIQREGAPWAEKGNRVIYARYAGKKLVDPETEIEYVVLNDEDIICVVTGEK